MIDELGDRPQDLRSIRRTFGHITTQYGLSLNHLSTLLPSEIARSVFAEQCLGRQYTTIDSLKSQCRQGAHRYLSQVDISPREEVGASTGIKSSHRVLARRHSVHDMVVKGISIGWRKPTLVPDESRHLKYLLATMNNDRLLQAMKYEGLAPTDIHPPTR